VQLEGLGKLKKFDDLIKTRIRDLPACIIVPQPTMLQYDPTYVLICWLISKLHLINSSFLIIYRIVKCNVE
jgi:hypothetical protein